MSEVGMSAGSIFFVVKICTKTLFFQVKTKDNRNERKKKTKKKTKKNDPLTFCVLQRIDHVHKNLDLRMDKKEKKNRYKTEKKHFKQK